MNGDDPAVFYPKLEQGVASGYWLVTGAAGFIGSHLIEALLRQNQRVIGFDNLTNGSRANLLEVKENVGPGNWKNFRFVKGDLRNKRTCNDITRNVDYILHQAAIGSVPRSITDPVVYHHCNVTGFLNLLLAARDNHVKRFVYASSSSVYGDHEALPKREDRLGQCLSPYAATKLFNEHYAQVFERCYGVHSIGLRYFNIFGPRQNPDGAYAAVIPAWINALLVGRPVFINGDGESSRGFCFVANAVQANLLAATTQNPAAINSIYNISAHGRTTLNSLFLALRNAVRQHRPEISDHLPRYREFRAGDVRHSEADIFKAQTHLGYRPSHTLEQGLVSTVDWYVRRLRLAGQNASRQPIRVNF
jgi:UDP-N-acetylglucosamine/UDP-N-acetylgalactosamine 4-epimerase